MAKDVSKIIVGSFSKVEISPYVSAKGAGTFVDEGYSAGGGFKHTETYEHVEVEVDQELAPVAAVPKKRTVELEVTLAQAEAEVLRIALGEPSGSVTGTPPNMTVARNLSAVAQYHQIKITTLGTGTTGARTLLYYRAYVKKFGSWEHKKDGIQGVPVTFGVLRETTGTQSLGDWNSVDA